MKKLLLFAIITVSFLNASAQTKDTLDVKIDFYVGIGIQVQNNLNINSKLALAGLPTVPTTNPEFILGLSFFGKKYSGSIEGNGVYFRDNNGPNTTDLATANIRSNFSYNLINKEKIAVTAGLNATFSFTQFNIYNSNTVVDLNNLNPSSNTGLINLHNSMIYLGPSASLFLFKNTKWQVRLNAAYEFGVARGSWKSNFANVNNTVNERGNNRFVFGFVLL